MNTKYTRHMNLLRRAWYRCIMSCCLCWFVHAESIAIPSARPMVMVLVLM